MFSINENDFTHRCPQFLKGIYISFLPCCTKERWKHSISQTLDLLKHHKTSSARTSVIRTIYQEIVSTANLGISLILNCGFNPCRHLSHAEPTNWLPLSIFAYTLVAVLGNCPCTPLWPPDPNLSTPVHFYMWISWIIRWEIYRYIYHDNIQEINKSESVPLNHNVARLL